MSDICQDCNERPATVHLCEVVDGHQKTFDLCETCFRSHAPNGGMNLPLLDGTQVCYYCGAAAQCSGLNQAWEQEVRKQRFHFTCFRCAELERQFMMQTLDAMPKDLDQDQQILAIQGAIVETEHRVRERIQNTGS